MWVHVWFELNYARRLRWTTTLRRLGLGTEDDDRDSGTVRVDYMLKLPNQKLCCTSSSSRSIACDSPPRPHLVKEGRNEIRNAPSGKDPRQCTESQKREFRLELWEYCRE